MAGTRNILISAGPTREYIDPVRYISNDSSGRMGFAIAEAAIALGMDVTIVAGPVSLPTPTGARRIDVVTAEEMMNAMADQFHKHDIVVMAAAVADFSPVEKNSHKIKKDGRALTIRLKENPDVLKALSKMKSKDQVVVGFALETRDVEKNACRKLCEKGLDWIVANDEGNIGSESGSAVLISKDGTKKEIRRMGKEDMASIMLSHIVGKLR
jgi:phosphopantothenoylcysteine decarboxylase/phosphopantothenate--cysteine ligase